MYRLKRSLRTTAIVALCISSPRLTTAFPEPQATGQQSAPASLSAESTAVLTAFVAAAATGGVREGDITAAIVGGRFVPPREQILQVGRLLGSTAREMRQEWDRRFGSLMVVPLTRTVVRDHWVERTGMDLIYLLFM